MSARPAMTLQRSQSDLPVRVPKILSFLSCLPRRVERRCTRVALCGMSEAVRREIDRELCLPWWVELVEERLEPCEQIPQGDHGLFSCRADGVRTDILDRGRALATLGGARAGGRGEARCAAGARGSLCQGVQGQSAAGGIPT